MPKAKGADAPKMGRPSKYRPEFCDDVVNFMGQGYSLTAFAGKIGVCGDTVRQWQHDHPDFSAAVKKGQAARTMRLETTLLEGETGPKVTAHIFALKNAAPEEWREKQEIDLNVTMDPDQAKARLAELLGKAQGGDTSD